MKKAELLEALWDRGGIEVSRGSLFDLSPGPCQTSWDRLEGMMLGLAIGDSLGNTTEGRLPQTRKARYGEIRDYVKGRRRVWEGSAPSDDTQMAFWTLDQLNKDRGFVPEQVASRFVKGQIFGIGQTVAGFRRAMKAGQPWWQAGPGSAGNGALMRIAPIVFPHLEMGTSALWVDAALCAMMTHNDSASIAGCLAFVRMLWRLLESDEVPAPEWWLESWVALTRELECNGSYAPRGGRYMGFEGHLWEYAETGVSKAWEDGTPVVEACNGWYSGAYLLETVPSVLYILMRFGHDPEEALVRAVNDTKDNDTVAAIVGAAMGALHGASGLPERWRSGLVGHTTKNDPGRVFEILAEARSVWR